MFPLPVRAQDLDAAARTVWAEARGEGFEGMFSVACVILNRTKRPCWWSRERGDGIPDDTIEAVCHDPWQFSCWNADDPNRPRMLALTGDDILYRAALTAVALAIISGKDPTCGSTHYMTRRRREKGWPKNWGEPRDPIVIIGEHLFYNDIE